METSNATIEGARLGFDRGVFLCAWLTLDYGGVHQSFGGYALDGKLDAQGESSPTALCGLWVARILRVADVEQWGQLAGRNIRVRYDRDGFNRKIIAIGHITKDIWFNPTEEHEAFYPTEEVQ